MKKPPRIILESRGETNGEKPFLVIDRKKVRAIYPDGTISPEFTHDIVKRRCIDAAVMVAYFVDDNDEPNIYFRSSLRPALHFGLGDGNLWEMPAGLIEPNERPAQAAQRELLEELGFWIAEENKFKQLGECSYPAVGLCSEQLFFYSVEVDPQFQREPELDGSPLEHGGDITTVKLVDAMNYVRAGIFKDMKTEIAIRRFEDYWFLNNIDLKEPKAYKTIKWVAGLGFVPVD